MPPHDNQAGKKLGGDKYNFDESMQEILGALDQIKKNIPNGELKAFDERFSQLEEEFGDLYQDVKDIKKCILDPSEGIIVKLNKSIEINKKYEEYRDSTIIKKVDSITQLENWKSDVTKFLWILFAAVIGIILNAIFRR